MATNALYVTDKNGASISFDPVPLVGISVSPKRNRGGYYADECTITLNGYIVNSGSPPASGNISPGPFQPINTGGIFAAQDKIRSALSASPLKIELNDPVGTRSIGFTGAALENLEFEEGTFAQYCRWTATLKAYIQSLPSGSASSMPAISPSGIDDFNIETSIEPSDEYGYCYHFNNGQYPITSIYYTYRRTVSAVGLEIPSGYGPYSGVSASYRAKEFIRSYISTPATQLRTQIESGLFKYVSSSTVNNWQIYNVNRSQTEDLAAGSFSITESCIIAPSGSYALETFTTSTSASPDSPYYKVSIEGTLKGLTTASVDALTSGITNATNRVTFASTSGSPSSFAHTAYNHISNSGNFGFNSALYKRANSMTEVGLNTQPLSISIANNPVRGEITYNLEFDNRPGNFFSNVMSERIEVNDTYPGDIFATIPILGRPTGPILQYTFGRTEYKRELSLEVILDHTWIGYDTFNTQTLDKLRSSLLYTKPSMRSGFRGQLNTLIGIVSPANEPGVRRYFLSPPRETWNPKEGRYTLNLEWTYEISE